MALFTGNIRSQALGMETQLDVILPDDRPNEHWSERRVLYLLHGLGENASNWHRFSGIERYVRDRGMAVIMPEVQRSFYCDMIFGMDYFTYVTQELPDLCSRMFGIAHKRENTFIAGLSMGGYGALRCAFLRPDLYRACASFSGALDMHYVVERLSEDYRHQCQAVLGTDLTVTDEHDLYRLAERAAARDSDDRPRVLMTCGLQDYLLDLNRAFAAHLRALPLSFEYREWDGEHNWIFWDRSAELAVEFFLGQ